MAALISRQALLTGEALGIQAGPHHPPRVLAVSQIPLQWEKAICGDRDRGVGWSLENCSGLGSCGASPAGGVEVSVRSVGISCCQSWWMSIRRGQRWPWVEGASRRSCFEGFACYACQERGSG